MKRFIFLLLFWGISISWSYGQGPCNASFTIVPDSTNPCRFSFVNTSTGGMSPLYFWNFGNGNLSALPNPTHTYGANGSYRVTLTMSDSLTGCLSTTTELVQVINCGTIGSCTAALSATPDTTFPCTYIFNSIATGVAPFTYFWSFGNGGSSTLANPIYTYPANGTYTVGLRITDANGCVATATQTILVTACPTTPCQATFFAFLDSSNLCSYSFLNFSSGPPPLSYNWSFGDGNTSTQVSPSHIYAANGTYRVTLVVSNPLTGCFDSTSQVITLSSCATGGCASTLFSFPDTTNPCTYFFSGSSTGVGPFSYQWNFGNGSTSSMAFPTHSYTANGTYVVTVTIIDANGCSSTASQPVVVSGCSSTPCQASFFAFPDSMNPCIFNFSNNATGSSPLNYTWSFGNGSSSTQANPSHTYSSNGTYRVTLLVSDSSGCFDSTSQTITVSGCATGTCTAAISAIPDTANPCVYYFSGNATGTAPFTYRWNFGNGSAATTPNPTHGYTANGTYIVTLSIIDANGCLATATQTVVITGCGVSPCQASFIASPDSSNSCTYQFSNNSTPAGSLTYLWNFGDGNTSSFASPSHTYASNGTYRVTLIISNTTGCFDSTSQTIVVSGCSAGTCQAVFSTSVSMANPCTYLFTDLSTSNGPITTRNWDFGDGNNSTQPVPTHTYAANGTYTVRLIITDVSGCTDTAFQTLMVTACGGGCQANFSSTVSMTNPCTYMFTDLSTSTGVIVSRMWDFGDGNTSFLPNPTHTYLGNGSYTVSFIIIDNMACVDTITQVINVTGCQSPNCQAGLNIIQDRTDSCLFTFVGVGIGTTAPVTYRWDFGDGNTATGQNPSHIYGMNGAYQVVFSILDANNCTDTVRQIVQVNGCDTVLCDAHFLARQDAANNRRIHFTDNSTGNPTAWLWSFGDGSNATSQNPTHTYNSFGTYVVNLTIINISNNCGDTWQDTIVVDNRMSLTAEEVKTARFYPNPATTDARLELELAQADAISWEITDMMGRKLIEGEAAPSQSHQLNFNLSDLSAGYYALQLKRAGRSVYVKRFIKK